MKRSTALLAVALFAAPAFAVSEHHAATEQKSDAQSTAADTMAEGEVKKVDKGAGKVTIKHGPLVSLDMPAMTMVFRVNDASMLDRLRVGENIRFKAERIGGNITVTEYQSLK